MKKWLILVVMALSVALLWAQTPQKLLIIDSQDQEPYKTLRESMLSQLENLGYAEGKNLEVDYESVGNYSGAAFNLLRRNVIQKQVDYDVIFVNGTIASQGALQFLEENDVSGRNLKFVFGNVTDPVGLGMVEELGKPATGLFTGIAYPVSVEERLRFLQRVFGENLTIGFVYADMPQSHSYNKWLEDALQKEEFKNLKFIFQKVEFVKSDGGHQRMTLLAKEMVKNLNNRVDLFLSPNDQLGSSAEYAQMIAETASKPLVGLAKEKGAVLSYAPDLEKNGQKIAQMIVELFSGKAIAEVIPQSSESTIYKDEELMKKFGITMP